MAIELSFEILEGDFSLAGKASSKIKKMLKQLNVDAKIIKRIVVAIYEAEVNVVAHSYGGNLQVKIDEKKIEVTVTDRGPGIENIEQAMKAGYSTASKKVREMGFGAGMGLPNIRKNTDELEITSKPGGSTTLFIRNFL